LWSGQVPEFQDRHKLAPTHVFLSVIIGRRAMPVGGSME
jgi:hypothetical protein